MDIITNFRALKVHKTILVVPKDHFDKVFNIVKNTHDVIEIEVTEELLKDAMLLITP